MINGSNFTFINQWSLAMKKTLLTFVTFSLLSLSVSGYADDVMSKGPVDCTTMTDDAKTKCMEDNKTMCDSMTDDMAKDKCMKNLDGNPTKM